jgi:hypothetical protein
MINGRMFRPEQQLQLLSGTTDHFANIKTYLWREPTYQTVDVNSVNRVQRNRVLPAAASMPVHDLPAVPKNHISLEYVTKLPRYNMKSP